MLIVPSPSLLVSIKLWKDILLLKFSNSNRELMLPETFFVNVVLIHSLELETVAKVERICLSCRPFPYPVSITTSKSSSD